MSFTKALATAPSTTRVHRHGGSAAIAAALRRGILLLAAACASLLPLTALAAQPPATPSLIVKVASGLNANEHAAVVARNGGTRIKSIPALRLHVVAVPAGDLEAVRGRYAHDPHVVSVEDNKSRQAEAIPSDVLYPSQWALPKIGWDSVFGNYWPSGSAKVALLDTGVDATHPELFGKVVAGTSILDGTNGMTDPSGHGTWLAGIIAANTNNATGMAGVAFAGVSVMPVTVLDAQGLGQDSDVIAGVIWAADNGADVIVMAFSNPGFSQNLQDAIDYAWSKNVVLAAAVGNQTSSTPTFPAGDRGVMGVAATDQDDLPAIFSNEGQSVFIAAPGTDIQTIDTGAGYSVLSGTSASTAIVGGVAGFMKAQDPTLSNGVIVGRIARTADPAGTPVETGNGRVNMARALADTSIESMQPAGADPVGAGGPFVGPYVTAAINGNLVITPGGAFVSTARQFVQRLTQTSGATNDNDRTRCYTAILTNFTGLMAVSMSAPVGKNWTVSFAGNTVTARANTDADKLFPNDTINVYFTATAPAAAGSAGWLNSAWANGTVASGTSCTANQKAFNQAIDVVNDDSYAVSGSPSSVAGGVSTQFTLTLTETGINKKGKQVEIVLPEGFTFGSLVSATASGGAGSCTSSGAWTGSYVAANNRLELAAGGSGAELCVATPPSDPTGGVLTVVFTATAPSTSAAVTWITNMRRDGNNFGLNGSEFTPTTDSIVPTVTSINRADADPTNLASVSWTVQFSENVTGVNTGDFTLVQSGGVSGASITGVTGSGTTYTVTASTGSGNGTLGLNLNDDDSIQDAAGNKLGGTGVNNGNFTGQVYTINKNTAPTANAQSVTANEDTATTITLSGSDANGDTLTFQIVSSPTNGSLGTIGSVTCTGTTPKNCTADVVYTPGLNFNGSDSFQFKVNDGTVDSSPATVSITITAVNDAPVITSAAPTTATEDTLYTYNATSSDPDGPGQTWSLSGPDTCGGSIGAASGVYSFTPAGPTPPASCVVAIQVCDGGSPDLCASQSTTVTITAVNDAPVIDSTAPTTATEDTPYTYNATSSDADGPGQIWSLLAGNTCGGAIGAGSGVYSFTPVGPTPPASCVVAIQVCDGGTPDLCASQSTTVTITAVNDAPVATDDTHVTNEDTPLTVGVPGVLGNDNDADGDALTAIQVSGPTNGTLTLNTDGSFTYTPAANYNGPDSFTYKANDGVADSNVATVNLTVTAVNDAPIAQNDTYNTPEDTLLTVAVPGVLGNDNDAADGSTTLTAVLVSGPSNGTLTLNADGSFSYTPDANFSGNDSFTYKANDGSADSNVATVTIAVTAVNDPTVANNDSYATDEDTPLTVAAPGVLANDTDVDSAALTAILVANPLFGTVTLNADGSFSYTPNADFNGNDSFSYKANDGVADSNVATVTLTIDPVNDAPVANDQAVTTVEDTPVAFVLVATDVDGNALTYSIGSGPANGTLSGTAPNLTYTPNANYNGTDSFTFKANDGTVDSNTATVAITVSAVNDAPVAQSQAVTTAEDTAVAITLVATDVDGNPLTYSIGSGPANGTLSGTAPNLTYTPNANFNGTDSFTFKANDGTVDSNIATVAITVSAVNDAPVAVNDSYSTNEDVPLSVVAPGVLGNDSDVDGNALTAVVVSGPANGSLTLNANGSFTYTPNANSNGPDSFTYKANDGSLDSNVATVAITVTAVNDAPVAANDAYSTSEDVPLSVVAPGVLGNDSDVDGNPLTAVVVSGPANGSLTLNANGSFTYTPNANYNGADSFTYKANDGTADSNVATVNLTVNAVNDAPVAQNDAYSTNQSTALNVATPGVLGNDTDVDGDAVTAVLVSGPSHGTLTLNADGSFSYTPTGGYVGPDSFTYQAKDSGNALSNVASVSITVLDNLPPIVSNTLVLPVALNTAGTVTATISDATTGGSNVVSWYYEVNGIPSAVFGLTTPAVTVNVSAALPTYSTTGVKEVCVYGTDAAGNISVKMDCVLLAVYDPSAGFVTGGGWITSPAGAYTPDPSLTGKATFGFVSKYEKGKNVPSGNTEFQFHAAGMNFSSTVYEWLVISGARGQYKGSGTIDGAGNYGFLLTAIDGQLSGGGGTDKFRIKIWDKNNGGAIVFDNQMGASDTDNPTTMIGGGSIQIKAR